MNRDKFIFLSTDEIHEQTNAIYEHLMDNEVEQAFVCIESIRSILKEIKSSFIEEL